MTFTFKYLFYILFIIGFYKIAEELFNAIKTKKIVYSAIDSFISLRDKICNNKLDFNEELIFLNQNCRILNLTSIGKLRSQASPNQTILDYILLNYRVLNDYCLKEIAIEALNSLIAKSIQVESEISIYKHMLNFINPIYYLKKSIHCILENFFSIFSINIPGFIKNTLELISAFVAILAIINTLSPDSISIFFKWLENLF